MLHGHFARPRRSVDWFGVGVATMIALALACLALVVGVAFRDEAREHQPENCAPRLPVRETGRCTNPRHIFTVTPGGVFCACGQASA